MTVKELIERLSECNPNAEVVWNCFVGGFDTSGYDEEHALTDLWYFNPDDAATCTKVQLVD